MISEFTAPGTIFFTDPFRIFLALIFMIFTSETIMFHAMIAEDD